MSEYLIPLNRLDSLSKQIQRIRNKGANITFDIVDPDVEYVVPNTNGARVIHCAKVNVEGTYRINGWRFVATIEHSEPENIIRVADTSMAPHIPERYRTVGRECEHCHIRRDRNDTYLVYNEEDNEWKQVGRTCLKNYTSGLDAETCAYFADVLSEIDKENDALHRGNFDELGDSWLNNNSSFNSDYVKKKAYAFVRDNGYVPGQTAGHFITALENDEIAGSATDEEIEEVNNWFEAARDNDYIRNARAAWNKRNFEGRDAGLITSAISTFFRDKQRNQARAQAFSNRQRANAENPSNQWAGEVGDKVTLTIAEDPVVIYTRSGGSYYNSYDYPVYKIVGTDGKVYIWGSANNEEISKGDILRGTIKKLLERRDGEKQTELTRCKVTHPTTPPSNYRGFFTPFNSNN